MGRIPIAPHTKVVTAPLAVHVVIEDAQLSVLEADARQAGPAGNRGGHHFHHDADAPLLIAVVGNLVAYAQKESFSFDLSHQGLHLLAQP